MDYHLRSINTTVVLELIIVEYNALPGSKSVSDVIRFPEFLNSARVISVSSEVHKQVCSRFQVECNRVVPILEFVAKNIGIRRARGRFVLPMAMDTILSKEWWALVGSGGLHALDETKLYRMFRADLGRKIPPELLPAQISERIHSWVYRVS